ncbi:unnamed protein product [Symbiodinium natans]|uniref:Uncharacterized protein n=1 Tax=Symbiodinium natans TaxID=878477 RepID=A0A812RCF9_9DINO|nr:unnamed protein product [Symbiodinium natans]
MAQRGAASRTVRQVNVTWLRVPGAWPLAARCVPRRALPVQFELLCVSLFSAEAYFVSDVQGRRAVSGVRTDGLVKEARVMDGSLVGQWKNVGWWQSGLVRVGEGRAALQLPEPLLGELHPRKAPQTSQPIYLAMQCVHITYVQALAA